jgi:hypothetical protein
LNGKKKNEEPPVISQLADDLPPKGGGLIHSNLASYLIYRELDPLQGVAKLQLGRGSVLNNYISIFYNFVILK